MISIETGAVLLGFGRALGWYDVDWLGIFAAIAATFAAWQQTKNYQGLGQSYAVTSHDVALVMACYASMLLLMVFVGNVSAMGWPYYVGLAIAGGIAMFHYTLIRGRDREQCFKAFLHNNWLGFTVFCGIMFEYAIHT